MPIREMTEPIPWVGLAGRPALETLAEALPEGLMMTDLDGTVTYWNAAAERITGLSRTEAVGQPCREVAGDRVRGCACATAPPTCQLLTPNATPFTRCCSILDRDGRQRVLFKNAVPLHSLAGERLGAIETFIDVTGMVGVECGERDLACPERILQHCAGLVGEHPEMQHLYEMIALVGPAEATVMILGESGTGKGMVARAIHAQSRRPGAFVEVNCSLFNANLLESELFGHVRGAFTGATRDRIGRFEEAQGGTLLLDEIGDLNPEVQLKLLRVVQERQVERVGESQSRPIDVRLLCATHRDLKTMVVAGSFRADLFFRLNVFPLQVPPLRQHTSDIPRLVTHFLGRQASPHGPPPRFTPAALDLLAAHTWPGNVRELEHAVAYAHLVAAGGEIQPRHLPPEICSASNARRAFGAAPDGAAQPGDREALLGALTRANWRRDRAARALGISRVTQWKRMKRLGLIGSKALP